MPTSLLALPYELREQILMPLLYEEGSIKLQRPVESPAIFTPPIIRVCKLLREEAVKVFCRVNTFTWTIDSEAVSSDLYFIAFTLLSCRLTSHALARIYPPERLSTFRLASERQTLYHRRSCGFHATLAMSR
jgi:hypothetical protein